MKVLSINVNKPRTIAMNGKQVLTAIHKKATTGKVRVFQDHIEGDGQADLKNHGGKYKAIYAYGVNHVAHWQRHLGKTIDFGGMGENLSIDQLNERDIIIGNRYQCGNTILKARLFRQPCFKLGAIHDNKELPTDFINYGHSGVYFSVEQEGIIEAGMDLELIDEATNSISVFDLFDACFQPINDTRAAVLKVASTSPYLPEEWTSKSLRKLQKAGLAD